MTGEFEDILDECLDEVLQGRRTIDACLERYPQQADELEPLLRVAIQGEAALQAQAPAGAREAGWQRVRDSGRKTAAAAGSVRGGLFGTRFRFLLKPAVLAAGLVVVLGSGTALAASGAEPDSILYPVKLGMEEIRTVVALQDQDQAVVEISHAQARLDEMLQMVDAGKGERVPSLLDRYNEHMNSAAGDMAAASLDGEDISSAEQMFAAAQARHDEILLAIRDRLPDDVRASIEDEIRDAEAHAAEDTGANGATGNQTGGTPESAQGSPGAMGPDTGNGGSDMDREHDNGGEGGRGNDGGPDTGSGGEDGGMPEGGDNHGGYQEPQGDAPSGDEQEEQLGNDAAPSPDNNSMMDQ